MTLIELARCSSENRSLQSEASLMQLPNSAFIGENIIPKSFRKLANHYRLDFDSTALTL